MEHGLDVQKKGLEYMGEESTGIFNMAVRNMEHEHIELGCMEHGCLKHALKAMGLWAYGMWIDEIGVEVDDTFSILLPHVRSVKVNFVSKLVAHLVQSAS